MTPIEQRAIIKFLYKKHISKYSNPSDAAFAKQVQAHEDGIKKMNELMAQYEAEIRKLKEEPDPNAYNKAKSSGLLKRPRLRYPPYPKRWASKAEFLKEKPLIISSHVLRPLIDLESEGRSLDAKWMKRLGFSFKDFYVQKGISMLAGRIGTKDPQRYEVLRNFLKKLDLPYEELTKVPVPKVKQPAPVRIKGENVIKKWWKIGGKLEEES